MHSAPSPSTSPADDTRRQIPTLAYAIYALRLGWWIVRSSVLALVLTTGGCGSPEEQGADARRAGADPLEATIALGSEPSIFGGARDDDSQAIRGVVALKVKTEQSIELCSGALISSKVVLTARHCVAKSLTSSVSCDERGRSMNGAHLTGDQEPSNIAVYVGASPKLTEHPVASGRVIIAPRVDHFCDSDIALVVLDRAVDDVAPIPVRLHAGVTPKERIRSVGYGQNDKSLPLGTRLRKAGVEVLSMGSGVSPSRTALGAHEFEVGQSICQGDSGGPAISEESGAVVGVVSRGGACNDDFGHIYTTTAGWSALFEEAFAVAGGAPLVEAGGPTAAQAKAQATPMTPGVSDEPKPPQSCSSTKGPLTESGTNLVLTLAGVLVLVARRSGKRSP